MEHLEGGRLVSTLAFCNKGCEFEPMAGYLGIINMHPKSVAALGWFIAVKPYHTSHGIKSLHVQVDVDTLSGIDYVSKRIFTL